MTDPAVLLALLSDQALHVFSVFLRIGAAAATLPAFGEQSVPVRLRLGLAIALSAVVAPALPPDPSPPALAGLGAEIVAGLMLGLVLRFFVLALQIAGTIAAQSTSLAQLFATAGGDPQPAISHLLVVAGLALATLGGLHVALVEYILLSYQFMPMHRLPSPSDLAGWGAREVREMFALAFALSAPFVAAAFVYNLALGAISKAMPQLMVAFVGAPAITGAVLGLLALCVPLMLSVWLAAFRAFLAAPVGLR